MNKLFIFLLVISDFVAQASDSPSRLSAPGTFPRDGWKRTDLRVETSEKCLGRYVPDVPVREHFLQQPQN